MFMVHSNWMSQLVPKLLFCIVSLQIILWNNYHISKGQYINLYIFFNSQLLYQVVRVRSNGYFAATAIHYTITSRAIA